MENNSYTDPPQMERVPVYSSPAGTMTSLQPFLDQSQNSNFRRSRLTILSLIFLLILYPGISIGFSDDPTQMLRSLNEGTLMVLLVSTIAMQWAIFLFLYDLIIIQKFKDL